MSRTYEDVTVVLARVRALIASVGTPGHQGPYGTLEAITTELDYVDAGTAALIAAAPELLAACELSYLSLLRLSPSERVSRQRELCACRDAMAKATGKTEEETQTEYEAIVRRKLNTLNKAPDATRR